MMRKIIEILFVIFVIIASTIIYLQYDYVTELKKQIIDRDSTITKYENNDSIYNSRLKQYTDTVEKYISPNFTYVDRKIYTDELLKITNNSMEEVYLLKHQLNIARDSMNTYMSAVDNFEKETKQLLNKYQDSAFIYKGYVGLAKLYGFKFSHKKNGDNYTLSVKAEQVDSALRLLPYFRDRLTYNSKKKCWEIETRKGLFRK